MLKLVGGQPERSKRPDALVEVAAAAVAGDSRAIRTLLVTVGPHVLRVARKVLGASHPDVDDVAQESAFAVIDALPGYRGESTVLHFVCRVALLTAMNVRRRDATLKRRSIRDDAVPVEFFPSGTPAPDAGLIAQARVRVVRELLDALPIEQAEMLAMHCVLGYTVREIADVSGAAVETVRSRLRLSKHALRERVIADPRLAKIVGEES